MSNVPITDSNNAVRKVDTFVRTEGADTVEVQAVAVVNPNTGNPLLPAIDGSMPVTLPAGTVSALTPSADAATNAALGAVAGAAGTSPPALAAGASGLIGWLRKIVDVLTGGSLTVTGPATDTELRASPLPVSISGSIPVTIASAIEVTNDAGNPLPVSGTVAVSSSALPAGAATVAGQAAIVSALGAPLQAGGTVALDAPTLAALESITASTGGLTDAQLRAAAVPMSASALPLPSGAATETTLATLLSAAQALQAAAEALNAKTTAVNTGAIAGTVALDAPTLAALGTGGSQNSSSAVEATSPDAPEAAFLVGDPAGDLAGLSIIESLTDPQRPDALTLNVAEQQGPARDSNNRLQQSDAPTPISLIGKATDAFVIDTQGYQSLNITSFAQTANISASNDPEGTFIALSGTNLAIAAAYVTATVANSSFSFPCIARYIKVTIVTAGAAVAYLRAAPWVPGYSTPLPSNVSQLAGTSPVTAGVAGTLAVGGNIAVGTVRTANPLPMGAVDATGLTRVLLTDTSGRPIIAGRDPQNNFQPLPLTLATNNGTPSVPVRDFTLEEGQTSVEILGAIQRELMIVNHYLSELPNQLNAIRPQTDEPARFRNDPSFFNQ